MLCLLVVPSRVIQILIMVAALAVAAYLVIAVAKNWADWVVFGMLIVTLVGAGIAIYPRRYKTKKRTFVRTTKPPR
jgi:membrane protein implicated in regulation of membrane protease activity